MRILWTQGDTNGIGSELILKAFEALRQSEHQFVVVGSYCMMKYYAKHLGYNVPMQEVETLQEIPPKRHGEPLYVLSLSCLVKARPGEIQADAGHVAMQAVETAATLCLAQSADAMVTAPIHKQAIQQAGYFFQGHTDFLEHLCRKKELHARAQMILVEPQSNLRVALATVHTPLKDVSEKLRTSGALSTSIESLAKALKEDFGVATPRIAVLGLNPHASDGGVIGREEVEVIQPEIERLKETFNVEGPFAADGFFGARRYKEFDAVLALYHDQGLIPFKMLAFETGVNVTTGLPIVRTSPDHGTAFDIAGKGIANPRSFIEATLLAGAIATKRKRFEYVSSVER